jgi:hypothetical protein
MVKYASVEFANSSIQWEPSKIILTKYLLITKWSSGVYIHQKKKNIWDKEHLENLKKPARDF